MYVKLFSKILDSSIWLERDSTLRVWITLLVSMDQDGFCQFAAIENLATRARVKPCHTKTAVAVLESPDTQSSNDGHEGRRIERVQGGWMVLNAKKYRDITRSGELRSKRSNSSQVVSTGFNSLQVVLPTDLTTNGISESLPEVEVEVEVEVIKPKPIRESHLTDVYLAYPRKVGKPQALKAIKNAIMRLVEGEAKNPISNVDEAVVYLCQRTALFARSPAGNNGQYTPHPATWFNRSSYTDDESEWSKQGNGNGQNQREGNASLGKQADRNESNRDAILAGIFGSNAGRDAAHGSGTGKDDPDPSGVGNVGKAGGRLLT